MHDIEDVRAVSFVIFQDGIIHNAVCIFARLHVDGISGIRRIAHVLLVHEAVAVLVDQQVRLAKDRVDHEPVQVVRKLINHLNVVAVFRYTDLPHAL